MVDAQASHDGAADAASAELDIGVVRVAISGLNPRLARGGDGAEGALEGAIGDGQGGLLTSVIAAIGRWLRPIAPVVGQIEVAAGQGGNGEGEDEGETVLHGMGLLVRRGQSNECAAVIREGFRKSSRRKRDLSFTPRVP